MFSTYTRCGVSLFLLNHRFFYHDSNLLPTKGATLMLNKKSKLLKSVAAAALSLSLLGSSFTPFAIQESNHV